MDPSARTSDCNATPADPVTGSDSFGVDLGTQLHRNPQGWRRIVLNFTPAWFAVTMGTGITSILLHNLPYNATWLYWTSVLIFILNVFIFLVFTIISMMRYLHFNGMWTAMISHPVQSLFLGTFPMGLSTIINMIVFVCVPIWGSKATAAAWALWWFDVVISLGCNLYLPFIVMHKHESHLQTMTAAWLLPIVATIVASSSGAILASVLEPPYALVTIITSYIIWGSGVSMACFTLAIYFQRLTLHALPPREVIVSVFLPLGPFGQGAFGIMQLGADCLRTIPDVLVMDEAPAAGQVLYVIGILVGLLMWGCGLVWLFFAVASITRSKFPFNLGWWGFTFPLGVYAVATTQLGKELSSRFFNILGTIFSLMVVFLWMVVSAGTLKKSWTGEIFVAPCLKTWEENQARRQHPQPVQLQEV